MLSQSFYIASSRDGIRDVQELADFLTRRGMHDAFDWRRHFGHVCSAVSCGIRDRDALAEAELAAARWCDLFVGIARLGKGSHVELGAALSGTRKRVVLVGVDRADLVFYDNRHVEVFASLPSLLKRLSEEDPQKAIDRP